MILRPSILSATSRRFSPFSFTLSTQPQSLARRPLTLLTLPIAIALGLFLPFPSSSRPLLHFDSPPSPSPSQSSATTKSRQPSESFSPTSLHLSPSTIAHLSLGSILGLGTGLLISAFSRTLSLLFGVGVVVVQYAASKGWNVVPAGKVEGWVRRGFGDGGQGLVEWARRDTAFKVAFGVACGVAGWGEF